MPTAFLRSPADTLAGVSAADKLRHLHKQRRGGLLLQEDVDQDVGRAEGRVGPQRRAPNQDTNRETTSGVREGGLLRPQDTGDVGMAPSSRDDNRGPIADTGTAPGDAAGGTAPVSDQPDEPTTMTDAEVQSTVHKFVWDAIEYVDQELSPFRALASKYYQAEPFGNEEEGRSQVVLTDLRDTVLQIMPSLMRLVFGVERPLEYTPRTAEQVEMAEQATEYIWDVVVNCDNRGYLVFYEWFKDALIKRLGILKYWYDRSEESKVFESSYLTGDQLALLEQKDNTTVLEVVPTKGAPPGVPLYDVEYKQTRSEGRLRLICLPPEEFLFTRGARTVSSDAQQPGVALFVGHRTELTRSQLLAMGVSAEDIEAYGFKDASLDHNQEEIARQSIVKPDTSAIGPIETQKALYIEGYPYLDYDGDGIAELRRVCMLGPGYHVISNEACAERPFCVISPDPEPHTIIGQGVSDWTMDIQKIKSSILRSALDSLALTLNPRIGYVEGDVSLEDLLNMEIGAPVRMRAPNSMQPIDHDFVGREALNVMGVMDQIKDDRVGALKESAGLTPDALQSITPAAASAAISAAQAHIEMIARSFAEMGLAPLFRALLRLLVQNQAPARLVRMRGTYVPMNPDAWDADLDVRVNVTIGTGLLQEKIDTLGETAAKMEGIFNTMGLSNPIVTPRQYRDTLVKILKLRGRPDAEEFYQPVDPKWQPPPAPTQDPQMVIAQAEAQKAQAEVQAKQAQAQRDTEKHQQEMALRERELQQQEQKMQMDDARERQKMATEESLRVREMNLQHQAKITTAQVNAEVQASAKTKHVKVEHDPETGRMTGLQIEESGHGK